MPKTLPAAALLAARRRQQLLLDAGDRTPAQIVAWFGAVQAQDYAGAKWALGLRNSRLTDASVDDAFNRGEILRTHVLRPTWHFVAPDDLHWILSLSAPRVHAVNAPYYRAAGIDAPLMTRVRRVLARALAGGPKTRTELAAALGRNGIEAAGHRLAYIVMHAELDAMLCSGPRRGRQFTYELFERRAPTGAGPRDEALAGLTRRYFQSHGPATLRDFSWWSGLTQRDIKQGIEGLGGQLTSHVVDGRTYWAPPDRFDPAKPQRQRRDALLLPNYDESLNAYRDRQLIAAPRPPEARPVTALPHQLVVDGRVVGGWRRVDRGAHVVVSVTHDGVSCAPAMLQQAARRLSAFLERPVTLAVT